MAWFARALIVLTGLSSVACSDDDEAGGSDDSGGGTSSGGTSSGGTSSGGTIGSGGSSGSTSGGSSGSSSGGNAGSSGTAGTNPGGAPPVEVSPMPLISRDVPAFASGSLHDGVGPSESNDADPASAWFSDGVPGWIAYDLSGVPSEQREDVMVAFYAYKTPDFINEDPQPFMELPMDYTIEIHTGDGGGQPPSSGWNVVATVTGNNKESREHLIEFDGANWVRMNVTGSSDPAGFTFDFDVYSAPNGASDAWLFMGDSITFIAMNRAFSDLPQLVNDADASRWPAIIPAGRGGTSTLTAVEVIEEYMRDYPGRFVTLNYGTNDHAAEYQMEALVQAVIAANKIPVVPHVPWSDTDQIQTDGPIMNQMIDDLAEQYPQMLPGPDLWAAFEDRLDLIPSGDVHPNEEGQQHLRQTWATWMTGVAE